MRTIVYSLILIISLAGHAQDNIPTDYFNNPLNIPIILAGDFGELRGSHFHSGLDIKTQHRQGIPVHASGSGTVSRIKIQRYGYGKAMYVQHPNGYTSVYAHLSRFSPEIEAYVKAQQYEQETYDIELYPKPGELKVDQGGIIAFSGNTGGSTAPHLHFEIRDASQRPMNPMLFGLDVPDSRNPLVSDLMVYPLGDSSQVNQSQYRQKLRITKQADGSFMSDKIEAYGPIGFGIATVDMQDGAANKNGIYKIETFVNGNKNLEVLMDKFSFAETNYVKRMIDYGYYESKKKRVQKLFIEPNNPLSIFTQQTNKGVVDLKEDGTSYVYNMVISDFKGNKTSVIVPIRVKKQEILAPREVKKTQYFVHPNEALTVKLGKYSVYFPKGAFFDEHYLNLSQKDNVLHLGKDMIPVARNITIRYDASGFSPEDREHLYIGSVGYNDTPYYTGAYLDGSTLIARTKTLSDYTVALDDTPPEINPVDVKEGKWMSTYDELKFKITDAESGIKDFRATINGKFILMEYEYKDDMLTYNFADDVIQETENNLKLIVTDNVGNSATFTATFFRKK